MTGNDLGEPEDTDGAGETPQGPPRRRSALSTRIARLSTGWRQAGARAARGARWLAATTRRKLTLAVCGVLLAVVALIPDWVGLLRPTEPASPPPVAATSSTPSPAPPKGLAKIGQRDKTICTSYVLPIEITPGSPAPAADQWSDWALSRGAAEASSGGLGTKVLVTAKSKSAFPLTLTSLKFTVVERRERFGASVLSNECGGDTTGRFAVVNLDTDPPQIIASSSVKRTFGGEEWRTTPLRFPYTVTNVDTEPLLIVAQCSKYCAWTASLSWTDGEDSGTETIDDDGRPFLTATPTGDLPWYRANSPTPTVWDKS